MTDIEADEMMQEVLHHDYEKYVKSGGMLVTEDRLLLDFSSYNLSTRGMRGPKKGKVFKGTTLDKNTGRYESQINMRGRKYNMGWYDSEEKAAAAFNLVAMSLYGVNPSSTL